MIDGDFTVSFIFAKKQTKNAPGGAWLIEYISKTISADVPLSSGQSFV